MYLNEDEIFDDLLLHKLPESQKKILIATPEEDLIQYHHTFGQWLRNHYKLWEKENPHVVHDDSFHEKFPDQVSQRIIERLWCQLTGRRLTFKYEIVEVTPGQFTVQKVPRG